MSRISRPDERIPTQNSAAVLVDAAPPPAFPRSHHKHNSTPAAIFCPNFLLPPLSPSCNSPVRLSASRSHLSRGDRFIFTFPALTPILSTRHLPSPMTLRCLSGTVATVSGAHQLHLLFIHPSSRHHLYPLVDSSDHRPCMRPLSKLPIRRKLDKSCLHA
jgi:hypothetical protein